VPTLKLFELTPGVFISFHRYPEKQFIAASIFLPKTGVTRLREDSFGSPSMTSRSKILAF